MPSLLGFYVHPWEEGGFDCGQCVGSKGVRGARASTPLSGGTPVMDGTQAMAVTLIFGVFHRLVCMHCNGLAMVAVARRSNTVRVIGSRDGSATPCLCIMHHMSWGPQGPTATTPTVLHG